METKTCMRCGMLMDVNDVYCPCEESDGSWFDEEDSDSAG